MSFKINERVTTSGPYLIESIARACEILQSLGENTETLRLCEIASRAGLSKATAYRILFTLERGGLVERTQDRAYQLTFRAPKQRKYRLGYAAHCSSSSFSRAVCDSIRRAAFDERIDLLTLNNKNSRTQALRNAELFIRESVDLVIQFGVDPESGELIAGKLNAAGIPIIGLEAPLPGAIYYGADNYRAGLLAGRCLVRWAAQHWQAQADSVLLLGSDPNGTQSKTRLEAIASAIRQALPTLSDSQFITLNGKGRLEESLAVVRKYLRTSIARRVLIGAVNDLSAIGAIRAFEEAGRTDHCAAVGQNASIEGRSEMRDSRSRLIGSVGYFAEQYGEAVMTIATSVLRHRALPQALFVKHRIVTPENVDCIYPSDFEPYSGLNLLDRNPAMQISAG